MKNTLSLFALITLTFSQSLFAAPSFQDKTCKNVETWGSFKPSSYYEKECPGTRQLAQTVIDIHAHFIDPLNPESCRNLADRLVQIQNQALNSKNQSQLKVEASKMFYELIEMIATDDQATSSSLQAVGGKSHYSPGGLPCLQMRSELFNHYDRIERSPLEKLFKKARIVSGH